MHRIAESRNPRLHMGSEEFGLLGKVRNRYIVARNQKTHDFKHIRNMVFRLRHGRGISGQAEVVIQVAGFRRSGFTTVLATASPQELADAIAARLGMSAAIGTVSEVRDGIYTGRSSGPIAHGSAKSWRVQALLDARSLDARTSWAFSDSVNDLPLLSLVGNPVATNPDKDLAEIAQLNGWRVLESGQRSELGWPRATESYPFPF